MAAFAVVALAGCGGNGLTVTGTITDGMTANTGSSCNGIGTQQIALTNAAGTIIARDNSPYSWSGHACLITFSFGGVPQLAGYGIRVVGLGVGTTWLTPAQAARPVRLRIGAGFTVSGA
jgi:hypothetical protein